MQQLLLVSVGPVQEFIASARRGRDLWFGSWLLSEISKTVAREIYRAGGMLIFPAPPSPDTELNPDTPLNVANKILAQLPDGAPDPAALAKTIEAAVQTRLLDEIWNNAYQQIKQRGQIDDTAARAQIADLIEITWVSAPLGDYADSRDALEHMLAARKVTRAFAPVGRWSQAGRPKSSLDGLRESVILEAVYDWTELELFRGFGVRRGERLCGVGLLKRHGQRVDKTGGRVFSTSHVAALPLLERLDVAHQKAIAGYITVLQRLGLAQDELGKVPVAHPFFGQYDARLLFEERIGQYLKDEQEPGGKKPLTEAKKQLKLLLKAVTGQESFVPLPYYALLVADGDGMGKAIEARKTQPDHQALSRRLNSFAHDVSGIVAEHKGSLVYAGGDDLLAFVPLHTALACARALADRFKHALADYRYTEAGTDEPRQPTLSVGIGISHHLEPLSDALALARDAEKTAKAHPGKNALAVAVSKRSGDDRVIVGGWQQQGTALGALDARLHRFAELYAAGALPDGFAYELALLCRRLSPARNPTLAAGLRAPMADAARRILDRKRADQAGRQKLDDVTTAELRDLLGQMPLDQLAGELIVARMFAGALRQTGKQAFQEFAPAALQPREVL